RLGAGGRLPTRSAGPALAHSRCAALRGAAADRRTERLPLLALDGVRGRGCVRRLQRASCSHRLRAGTLVPGGRGVPRARLRALRRGPPLTERGGAPGALLARLAE